MADPPVDVNSSEHAPVSPGTEAGSSRFGFGENWLRFLDDLSEKQVEQATESFVELLPAAEVEGRSFLDIGSGSGLSSLVAVKLGAREVVSFDYDANSVEATASLAGKFSQETRCNWTVRQGDILDPELVHSLGRFDVVYSWGVLHHTGSMWDAVSNAVALVEDGGIFFIALYNDQGARSRLWRVVKRIYNRLPRILREPYVALVMMPFELRSLAYSIKDGDPRAYLATWKGTGRDRGMDRWRDNVDWVGGYPFEVASVAAVNDFVMRHGFEIVTIKPDQGWGCNQFVFRKAR